MTRENAAPAGDIVSLAAEGLIFLLAIALLLWPVTAWFSAFSESRKHIAELEAHIGDMDAAIARIHAAAPALKNAAAVADSGQIILKATTLPAALEEMQDILTRDAKVAGTKIVSVTPVRPGAHNGAADDDWAPQRGEPRIELRVICGPESLTKLLVAIRNEKPLLTLAAVKIEALSADDPSTPPSDALDVAITVGAAFRGGAS